MSSKWALQLLANVPLWNPVTALFLFPFSFFFWSFIWESGWNVLLLFGSFNEQ